MTWTGATARSRITNTTAATSATATRTMTTLRTNARRTGGGTSRSMRSLERSGAGAVTDQSYVLVLGPGKCLKRRRLLGRGGLLHWGEVTHQNDRHQTSDQRL